MRYPYNAQLAQYMEISGNVGGATRLARTVIIGNDMKLITHLLYILTYFVRCSAIQPNGNKGILKSLISADFVYLIVAFYWNTDSLFNWRS